MDGQQDKEAGLQTGFKAGFLARVLQRDWSMMERPDVLLEVALIGLPVAAAMITGAVRHRRWKKRQLTEFINFSLNTYQNGSFYFRTVGEVRLTTLLPEEGARRVISAARHATADEPIIPLDPETRMLVNNAAANYVSSLCSAALLAKDMGSPDVIVRDYVVCLTAESTNVARMQKIRCMIMEAKTMESLIDAPELPPKDKVEGNFRYRTRWALMRKLARGLMEQRKINPPVFMRGYSKPQVRPPLPSDSFVLLELASFGASSDAARHLTPASSSAGAA